MSIYAYAEIAGNNTHPEIEGHIYFTQLMDKVAIKIMLSNMPTEKFLGMHIHSIGKCDKEDNFESANIHYNPDEEDHPNHAGDLPAVYTADGEVNMTFTTDRFTVDEIVNKAIIIHSQADDFRSQPAGDSGERIACGVIEAI